MILKFSVDESDIIAFTERYLRDSKSHQALRNRIRWVFPCIMLVMICLFLWRDGMSPGVFIIFGGLGIAWCLFYPIRFDANIRSHAKKQLKESSYSKSLGPYELRLLDEHLHSTSPLGSSEYAWTGVDRAVMNAEYLYIFLSGPMGYPIRISEIGQDAAQQAKDFISSRISQ